MGLLSGIKDRIQAKVPIESVQESAERRIDKARMERKQTAAESYVKKAKQIGSDVTSGEISEDYAEKLRKRTTKKYDKESMLFGDRLGKGAAKASEKISGVVKTVSKVAVKEIKQARPWDVQGRPREEQPTRPGSYRMPGRPKSPRHSESLGGFKSPTYHKGEMYMPSARSFDTGLGMGTSRSKKKKKTGVPRALDMNFDWEI